MVNEERFYVSCLMLVSSTMLLTGNHFIGKVLISSEFTRGLVIGVSLVVGTVAVVWLMQEAYPTRKTKNGLTEGK